jgi:Asp-tRNA(Asn)/Glu-tRNA(Gln) amidotransferase A subunit family amidase
MALPMGIDDKGHPMSMILIGRLYEEEKLVALAAWIQSVTDYHLKHPKFFSN